MLEFFNKRLRDPTDPFMRKHGFKAFNVPSPQDIASVQKVVGRGGACKRDINFCHLCACVSAECACPRNDDRRCDRCKQKSKTNCYHHPVGDKKTLEEAQAKLNDMVERDPLLFQDDLDLKCRYSPQEVSKETLMSNIEYKPTSDRDKMTFAREYINHDLEKLGLSRIGSLEERRERLCAALMIRIIRVDLENTTEAAQYPQAMMDIINAIPCILHLENWCGEKIIKLLLIEGFNSFDGNTKAQDKFLDDFTNLVNTSILGSPDRIANWNMKKASKSKDGKTMINDQTMRNTHVRKFISKFETLSDFALPNHAVRREKWNKCISLYREVLVLLKQREDFTDEEIETFQDKCDEFYDGWIDLLGKDGVTNYFHMFGAGHLAYYLREWRNLWRYSQQGWEAFNAKFKTYFFRATQRGGSGGGPGCHAKKQSRLQPIGRWLQRKLYWLTEESRELL
jgi:hypothetical protein